MQLEVRLESEIALRQRLQRELELRDCAMDAAASHFMILDMQRPGWPIVYVNRAILRDYGYTPEEVVGHSASKFIATDLCPVQINQMNEAIRAWRPRRAPSCAVVARTARYSGRAWPSVLFETRAA